MPTIHKAMKGSRDAMLALYQNNRGETFRIANFLLLDEKEAEGIVLQIFKNIYKDVLDGAFASDEEFTATVKKRAILFSKARIERKDTAALRLNANLALSRSEYHMDAVADFEKSLSPLARFTFVLRALYEESPLTLSEGAKIFGANTAVYTEVFDAESARIARAAEAAGTTVPALAEEVARRDPVSETKKDTDDKVLTVILALVAPYEAEAKRKKKSVLISACAVLLLALIVVGAFVLPPLFDTTYYADIKVEGYGTITVVLDDESAPITVKNFVDLAESGFYDGLTFHRVVEGFVIQGGDPEGNGTGGNTDKNGNKITIKGEFALNGVDNRISHTRGVISMARSSNDYNSASSQFFIVHEDSAENLESLDGQYAAFGHVISGMEYVDAICKNVKGGTYGAVPRSDQPVIESITIRKE